MQPDFSSEASFADLGLPARLFEVLTQRGYHTPSPIQRETIPVLLKGGDVIGMAQTGTGKTAAFALPMLSKIDPKAKGIQALILCPTRELAIQVAEACQAYAEKLDGCEVLPVYGGQDMRGQLRALRRGVQVVVGTPGRLLDHVDRGSLDLSKVSTIVLDEADEMLRMGFLEDVERLLSQAPDERQTALFSATMPKAVRQIANKYLQDPAEIKVAAVSSTNENIEQRYCLVGGYEKFNALSRLLEVEPHEGVIIFARTKSATVEVADKLRELGMQAAALNGDMNQSLRVAAVEQLKKGGLDIVVATDVAARGLDVERISHVFNFDIPFDEEAYVHRIGRTGRAGRSGKAILLVTPRERRMLRSIERVTGKEIQSMEIPSADDLMKTRKEAFKAKIVKVLETKADTPLFNTIVEELSSETGKTESEVAAAMAFLLQKDQPLHVVENMKKVNPREKGERGERGERNSRGGGSGKAMPLRDFPDISMQRYRLSVGRKDKVTPREIVGAIANEAKINGKHIGHIQLFDTFSTVDLPADISSEAHRILKATRVRQRALNIVKFEGDLPAGRPARRGSKPTGSKPRPRRRTES